jgi:hypothetical protein
MGGIRQSGIRQTQPAGAPKDLRAATAGAHVPAGDVLTEGGNPYSKSHGVRVPDGTKIPHPQRKSRRHNSGGNNRG